MGPAPRDLLGRPDRALARARRRARTRFGRPEAARRPLRTGGWTLTATGGAGAQEAGSEVPRPPLIAFRPGTHSAALGALRGGDLARDCVRRRRRVWGIAQWASDHQDRRAGPDRFRGRP